MRASRRVNATVLATTVMSLLFAFACSGGMTALSDDGNSPMSSR